MAIFASDITLIAMESRIKELCKERGMRMSDLADKMGVNQANLAASIKGNPTLSRLKDIARILGVDVTELLTVKETESVVDGFVEVDGKISRIKAVPDLMKVACRMMEFPYYSKVSDMREAVGQFVYSAVKEGLRGSLTGCLFGSEIFSLAATEERLEDVDNTVFTLTLFRGHSTHVFEELEYGCDGECDLDGDLGMVRSICNLIEWQYEPE